MRLYGRFGIAKAAGRPQPVGEAVGQFTECGRLDRVEIALEALIVLVRQARKIARLKEFNR